ncbi:uncharacterized protein GGS22DRAFT_194331 [Annulohypoxylon maeteangense]|uniref:uncharacterized protein n=1 Tax=Annulohypoxylon maeteangense TaxID=1927788 RepID=UPI002007E045|nr:uncharacterized protein GGS22DRAFT_194331 [Annulohypoxylon maeteangense]KAI0890122.1 hypothetical protein GGS22DRAFT_194331 [Annulohypoxylon maeteangense]
MAVVKFNLDDTLFDQDPKLIIRSVIAYPDYYFTSEFNIADRDGVRQATYRWDEASFEPFPVPLLNTAIEMPDTPDDILSEFIDGLDREFPGAINASYPVLHQIEPPLHAAMRVGRVGAVSQLVRRATLDTEMKYSQQHHDTPGYCKMSGFAHTGPCEPEHVNSPCPTALEYAIECYCNAQPGSPLRENIEQCALILVDANAYPAPFDNDSRLIPSFRRAIQGRMNGYVYGVINQLLKLPYTDANRNYLLGRGLEKILYEAAGAMENSGLVSRILDTISMNNEIFPIPHYPATLGANPIAAALENRCPQNACNISDFIWDVLNDHEEEPEQWVRDFLRNTDIIINASSTDDNYAYLENLMIFVHNPPITDWPNGITEYNEELAEYVRQCAYEAISSGKLATRNTVFLVEHGCDTALFWRVAIGYRNVAALMAMIASWSKIGKSLDEPQPAVPALEGLGGADLQDISSGWTILGAVVEARFLTGIVLVLNADANPNIVSHEDWRSLFDELLEAERDLSILQVVKIYFRGEFFNGGELIGTMDELEKNELVRAWLRLVIRIAELHSRE